MRTIHVTMSVTLDGVVQGPGRADEDTRDRFRHGGWGTGYTDQVMAEEIATGMSRPGDLLLGRRTWQDFSTAWGGRQDGNPFSAHLDNATKYVVSTTLDDADAWQNSILLRPTRHRPDGNVTSTIAALKAEPGPDLSVIGSASLVRTLHSAGLVDRYTLLIHPLVLGAGSRLFDTSGRYAELSLTDSTVTTTGVIIAHYRVAGHGDV
ncbi:dihydrofolate reductase family protein [Microlunatus soli]|uniref:Dihydrofolate reductase n=1 Tax=Microlunatus soli TaxID=630515 RepID=A0A1H1XZG8_9ACTN|nr:dihydrofolate reductase family protein [Microlunatus soli]SDT14658.1 Dihydrofolate reductase [Microlunatus soli]